jgi:hypothetical protein
MTTPPVPAGSSGVLQTEQRDQLPIANALAIPRLIASSSPPDVNLISSGLGGRANHSA